MSLVLPLTPMLAALRDVAIDSEPIWDTWPYLAAMHIQENSLRLTEKEMEVSISSHMECLEFALALHYFLLDMCQRCCLHVG